MQSPEYEDRLLIPFQNTSKKGTKPRWAQSSLGQSGRVALAPHSGSQPAKQPASRPASQPDSQPANQPARRPAKQPSSQPASASGASKCQYSLGNMNIETSKCQYSLGNSNIVKFKCQYSVGNMSIATSKCIYSSGDMNIATPNYQHSLGNIIFFCVFVAPKLTQFEGQQKAACRKLKDNASNETHDLIGGGQQKGEAKREQQVGPCLGPSGPKC